MNGFSRRGSYRTRFTWRTLLRPAAAAAVAGGLILGVLAVPAVSSAAAPSASPATAAAGTYVPVTPTRITDTRAGSGEPNAGDTIGPAGSLTVQVGGVAGVPANASVAVLNVTAINPTVDGFLSVNPGGQSGVPTVSNLNFVAGQTVANLVTVPLSSAGAVSIFNHAGNTDVAVDVFGYYTPTPATDGSGLYNSVNPYRALGNLQSGVPIGPGGTQAVTVTGGSTGVPSSASAVVVNLTAAGGTTPSYLSTYAAGTAQPVVSNLNLVANQVVANRATVPVGTGGQIEVFNHDGTVNVDVDISGYYSSAGGTGSTFVPVTPERLTDTRTPMNGTPIAQNTTEAFNLTSADIPANAQAVATNVTAVAGNAPGFLTVYPTALSTPPTASDVNWSPNQVVPNFTIAPTQGTGNVNIFNNNGATLNVVIDAFGYFAPTPRVVVTANPGDIAPGTGTSVITATVSLPNGSPVANDAVHIASAGPANVCGTLNPVAVVTNASGKATFNYKAGTAAGVCTFTVTESSQGGKGTVAITQGNAITLSSASASVPADGTTTDVLTANVTSAGGPVVGDAVTFTTSASPAGACGTLSHTTVNTDGSGNAVTTYTSSTTPGFCAITATESGSGNTSSTSINQTATSSPVINVAVAASPASITADGTSTSSIAATVTGAASAPVVGDQVAFSVSSGGGSFVNEFATTNAFGVATVTYTSSTSVGSFTITALEANGANSGQTTITQTAIPYVVALSASPTTLAANGLATSNVTVTITTPGGGSAGPGLAVSISGTGTCGTISSPTGTTGSGGTFATTYQASTTTGSCTLNATGGPLSAHAPSVTIVQTSSTVSPGSYAIAVAGSPTSIPANGVATSTISATVTTDSGTTPVPGDPVTFSAGSGCGALSTLTGTTSTSGVATTTLTATTTPVSCQISAVETASGSSGSTAVTQVAAINGVTVTPAGITTLVGNGTSTQVFTATVTPALSGGPVANDTVTFGLSGNPGAACGTLSPTSGSTGSGTTVQATYTSSTTSGFCTVTATESATSASGTALIDQTQNPAPPTATVAVAASPAFISANGSATSAITATVTNSSGPVVGDTVQFSASGTGIGTLSVSFAITNGSGVATVTYTASTTLNAVATVTATEANGGQTGTAAVQQIPDVTAVANPTTVAPSGTSTITVTVTHLGTGVPGESVGIGVSGACGTVAPNFGTTQQNGTFTTTYTGPAAGTVPSGSTCSLTAGVPGINVPFTITNSG